MIEKWIKFEALAIVINQMRIFQIELKCENKEICCLLITQNKS